jgi:hypothetical protein
LGGWVAANATIVFLGRSLTNRLFAGTGLRIGPVSARNLPQLAAAIGPQGRNTH